MPRISPARPSFGKLLGTAGVRTSDFTLPTSVGDLTDLTTTFTLSEAGVVVVELHIGGYCSHDSATSKNLTFYLTDSANVVKQSKNVYTPAVANQLLHSPDLVSQPLALAAGSYTYKGRGVAPATGKFWADTTYPSWIAGFLVG